jgi:histidyl-tRNA synthetase
MKVPRCKGCGDLSVSQMAEFRRIEAAFRETCRKWGYSEVRTPTLEYLHLFTATGTLTPGKLGKVYSFLDWDGWSGQRVVLRPDATIPVVRYYTESLADTDTARLYYVTSSFAFEETGSQSRERWQCGAELIGPSGAAANTEIISMALETLKELGIEKEVSFKLSHAGVIKALLAQLSLSTDEQARLFDRVLDGDASVLAELKPDNPELVKTLRLLLQTKGKTSGFLKNIEALVDGVIPKLKMPIDDFVATIDILDRLDIDYEIDLASGRGFEYYTGIIFHIYAGKEMVGGGGRYDALVSLLGGQEKAAAGFALYMDALIPMAAPESAAAKEVAVCATPEKADKAFKVTAELHQAGFAAEICMEKCDGSGYEWKLDVDKEKLELKNNDTGKKSKCASIAEAIELLETA